MSEEPITVGHGPVHQNVGRREPVMRSVAHRSHGTMGASFERRTRWEVPSVYGSGSQEAVSLTSSLGFADVSARGKVHLSGEVDGFIQRLTPERLEPQRTAPASVAGMVARIARDWALALVPPSGERNVLSALKEDGTGSAMATDVTSAMSGFLVAGPRLEDFFARSLTINVEELRPGRCAATSWARIPAVLVICDLAAPSVEIYVGSDHGRYAWETICRLCGGLGGSPVGWLALEAWGWK